MSAASGILSNVEIRAISCAVPDNLVGNEQFVGSFGVEVVEKSAKMTGVTRRCISLPEQTASDLSYVAAKRLFDEGRAERDEIDALIFVSQTPDYVCPATACVLHHRLGLKKECLSFDINLGCSGFVYGLFVAGSICRQEGIRNVLLCGGDTITKLISPEDKSSAMLFGDGGFATLLASTGENNNSWNYLFGTDGSGYKAIIAPSGAQRNKDGSREIRESGEGIRRSDYDLFMDGMEVFNFTISEVPSAIKRLMGQAGHTPEDTDLLVLHQANLFILKQISKMTKLPMEKVPVTIDRFGNTSVSSIPLTLCDTLADSAIITPRRVVLAGFGVGLSWGVISLTINPECCISVFYSSDVYIEGALHHG
ncbi:MAG: ketoacyl-ACP synthase III [Kiritimatiellae bacterium]|nr:ketoacyl-ACP synthase III [Kiritimatiellia bacterium]